MSKYNFVVVGKMLQKQVQPSIFANQNTSSSNSMQANRSISLKKGQKEKICSNRISVENESKPNSSATFCRDTKISSLTSY